MIVLFLFWVGGALFVAAILGSARTIGFWGALFVSLIFSPLLGLIISLFFPKNEKEAREKQMLAVQVATFKSLKQQSQSSLSDELGKLKKLLDDGILTVEEFDTQKKKLLHTKD